MKPTRQLNSIIKEPSYEDALKEVAAGKGVERLHDLEAAIDWALAREPKRFTELRDGCYLWRTEQVSDQIPAVLIAYRHDEASCSVFLISIKLA